MYRFNAGVTLRQDCCYGFVLSLVHDGSQISTQVLTELLSIGPIQHARSVKSITMKSVDDSWDLQSLLAERRDLEALGGQSERGSE